MLKCLSLATHAPQAAMQTAWLHDFLRLDRGSSAPWSVRVATVRQLGQPSSRPAGSTAGRQMTAGHGSAGLYELPREICLPRTSHPSVHLTVHVACLHTKTECPLARTARLT